MSALQKKKLLIISPTLLGGGTERYVSIIANEIDTKLFDVTVCVLDNRDPFYQITNPGVQLVDLCCSNVRKSLFKLKKFITELKPDIILSTSNHLNLWMSMFKRFLAGSAVLVARESSIVSISRHRAKMSPLYNFFLKMFYKRSDFIICQSVYMQEDLIKNYGIKKERTIVLHNPVLPVKSTIDKPAAGDAVVQLITVARLSEVKGIDRVLRAVSRLSFPYVYTIIGEGELRETLEGQVKKQQLSSVVFAGSQKKPFEYIKRPSLFLNGSYYEGFPNVVLEAGSFGIPVVAFNSPGGISEIIVNEKNGLLVRDNDEQAFAEAIEKAMRLSFNREEISQDTYKRFSASRHIVQLQQLLLSLSAKS